MPSTVFHTINRWLCFTRWPPDSCRPSLCMASTAFILSGFLLNQRLLTDSDILGVVTNPECELVCCLFHITLTKCSNSSEIIFLPLMKRLCFYCFWITDSSRLLRRYVAKEYYALKDEQLLLVPFMTCNSFEYRDTKYKILGREPIRKQKGCI